MGNFGLTICDLHHYIIVEFPKRGGILPIDFFLSTAQKKKYEMSFSPALAFELEAIYNAT